MTETNRSSAKRPACNLRPAPKLSRLSPKIKARLPGVHILCGVGNVSFQLPDRTLLDRTFLPMAMAAGVDTAIIDPCNNDIMASIAATEALLGGDGYCMRYIASRRKDDPGKPG